MRKVDFPKAIISDDNDMSSVTLVSKLCVRYTPIQTVTWYATAVEHPSTKDIGKRDDMTKIDRPPICIHTYGSLLRGFRLDQTLLQLLSEQHCRPCDSGSPRNMVVRKMGWWFIKTIYQQWLMATNEVRANETLQ